MKTKCSLIIYNKAICFVGLNDIHIYMASKNNVGYIACNLIEQ